jgi:hypothetical protein
MKLILLIALFALGFQNDILLRTDCIYIAIKPNDNFDIFRIVDDSTAVFCNYSKYPDYVYDFFESRNIGFIKRDFFHDEKHILDNICKYKRYGDSLVIIQHADVILNAITFGRIYKDKILMRTLYKTADSRGRMTNIAKREDSLVFKAY